MPSVKKITVSKDDEVALVIEKIIDAEAKEIVLIIPRFSHLGESLINFRLLKRESDILGKQITIESVDNKVIEYAGTNKLAAYNPFLPEEKAQEEQEEESEEKIIKTKKKKEFDYDEYRDKKAVSKRIIVEEEEEQEREELPVRQREYREPRGLGNKIVSFGKLLLKIIVLGIVLGALYMLGFSILPRAIVKISAKTTDWTYKDSIVVDKAAKVDAASMTIAGQVFKSEKNTEMKFPASGIKEVSVKATGKITVYNSYSSKSQPLAKDTRFASPDGKIFHLVKAITIPGASISEGKIIPRSIEADVVADKAGEEYNIGPEKIFTIPGFKGTPKYQAFYGESKTAMSGGMVGKVSYPTAGELKTAKEQISKTLRDALDEEISSQITPEMKIIDGATSFNITEQNINEVADADKNFSIFEKAQLAVIVFNENDLKNLLLDRASEESGEEYELKNYELGYGLARGDFQTGKLSFPVDFKAVMRRKIDAEGLKEDIAGLPDIDLRKKVFSVPGLENATVSLWPFWVTRVPTNLGKIKIEVD
ncbi:MAG: hypothetical protein PHP03_01350 [Candidatus Pacebacteria bacterium]|nr:hypothetical protein [Candidatus Paceibacterota bacterium]